MSCIDKLRQRWAAARLDPSIYPSIRPTIHQLLPEQLVLFVAQFDFDGLLINSSSHLGFAWLLYFFSYRFDCLRFFYVCLSICTPTTHTHTHTQTVSTCQRRWVALLASSHAARQPGQVVIILWPN